MGSGLPGSRRRPVGRIRSGSGWGLEALVGVVFEALVGIPDAGSFGSLGRH
jgi:hypothetical protein